ncbi:MAG: hypothetical protein JEY94_08860 [Melioribacteraceae bacterium]|nr:hypothetical protein [Melioribacteraceae bacterium]
MKYGQFNFYKIRFTLEILQTTEEKWHYLQHLQEEITRVLNCFEEEKTVPLRYYAEGNFIDEDTCDEFVDFISEMVKKNSLYSYDRHNPSNEMLRRMVRAETEEYRKLYELIDIEIQEIQGKAV